MLCLYLDQESKKTHEGYIRSKTGINKISLSIILGHGQVTQSSEILMLCGLKVVCGDIFTSVASTIDSCEG